MQYNSKKGKQFWLHNLESKSSILNTPQNGFVPPAVTVSERLVTSAKEAEMSELREKIL